MAAVATYLADISALARLHHPAVAAVLAPLIDAGVVATCGVIEFELGWATRSSSNSTSSEPTATPATNGSPYRMRTGGARLMSRPRSGAAGA